MKVRDTVRSAVTHGLTKSFPAVHNASKVTKILWDKILTRLSLTINLY
jgi:hypothetical protein